MSALHADATLFVTSSHWQIQYSVFLMWSLADFRWRGVFFDVGTDASTCGCIRVFYRWFIYLIRLLTVTYSSTRVSVLNCYQQDIIPAASRDLITPVWEQVHLCCYRRKKWRRLLFMQRASRLLLRKELTKETSLFSRVAAGCLPAWALQ